MDKIITASSSIHCMHQGTITPVADAVSKVLTIGGDGVLTSSLVDSAVGKDCTQVTDTSKGSQQCSKVTTETPGGASTVLTVGGTAVLLASDQGTTDGLPTFNWSVTDAKQTVLSAA
jgi:hypothetical protein